MFGIVQNVETIQDSLVVKRSPEQAIRTHSAHVASLLVSISSGNVLGRELFQ